MFRRTLAPLALAFALAFSAASARAEKETFVIDNNHTEIGFKVRHFVSKVGGHFGKFDGTIVLDRTKPEESSVAIKIAAASVDTGNPAREKHLNSPDFFDTAKFPEISFKSTKVAAKGKDTFDVTGDLTMLGVTKPVTLTVDALSPEITDPWSGQRRGLSAVTTINRKDFGMGWNAPAGGGVMLSENVEITLDLEMTRPAA